MLHALISLITPYVIQSSLRMELYNVLVAPCSLKPSRFPSQMDTNYMLGSRELSMMDVRSNNPRYHFLAMGCQIFSPYFLLHETSENLPFVFHLISYWQLVVDYHRETSSIAEPPVDPEVMPVDFSTWTILIVALLKKRIRSPGKTAATIGLRWTDNLHQFYDCQFVPKPILLDIFWTIVHWWEY